MRCYEREEACRELRCIATLFVTIAAFRVYINALLLMTFLIHNLERTVSTEDKLTSLGSSDPT